MESVHRTKLFREYLSVFLLFCIFAISCLFNDSVYAASTQENVVGKVYEFDDDTDYTFSSASGYTASDKASTYGVFSISGTESAVKSSETENGIPAYEVSDGNIQITYSYADSLLTAEENKWHIVKDKEENLDIYKLDSNIAKGALVLQRSIDGINWSDIYIQTNVFEDIPKQDSKLYETLDVELINGCYYRLIVAYELSKKVRTSKIIGLIPMDDYENKRIAEVYTFYAVRNIDSINSLQGNTKRYRLGDTVKVDDFDSYYGEKAIEKGDLQYNWEIGNFFVSGFTSNIEKDGKVVFLKNVGDVVTLWFNLQQNIDALNGNKDLSITRDDDGYDQYFQTERIDFGRGMLLIRYTDFENVKHDTVMYSNFLEANTSLNADTRVQLFEEGDYEVALDYEVTKDQLVDKVDHYRIFFKFSVRNANCMVYPFDVKTGAELANSSLTENGFYLDLAKSRYLNIFIKKENWMEGAQGLTEDTRFNTTAKDGDKYTDEGIYTITVKNPYTGLETTKEIYVGTNKILIAYMTSGYSLAEIQNLVAQGAVIYEDGSIELPTNEPLPEPEMTEETNAPVDREENPVIEEGSVSKEIEGDEENVIDAPSDETEPTPNILPIAVGCILAFIIVAAIVGIKKKKTHKGNG